MHLRTTTSLLLLTFTFALVGVEGKTQRVGDECNWKVNCQSHADGAGPSWAGGAITCAVPADNKPEACGSNDGRRSDFYGTCKAVGTLEANEYGCGCGVHGGDCPSTSPFSRIFWPQNWLKNAWGH
ncbi:hypothetical protein PSEUBRA_005428 [Kalmanozyma brasiliensis GHG001]|uniref:Uncharacterized protein n=1 Tax=Kalmanozyma brasiliensis (strain GHG001) TaxID=1365824 RepID=V5E4P7_KALBG|nr:uncharacterized protein PSEUBRA_005428 [Kalmanozyma brasiliensis GHG001]EST05166.1 hypothetical protein PSEUBRA_005428 [Kalmanozyma brasiliensis GHG001]